MKAFSRSFMLRYFKSFENPSHSIGIIHSSSFNLPMQANLSLYHNFYPYLSYHRPWDQVLQVCREVSN